MKYLINKTFKATRRGNFVSASESAGEFLFDTEDKDNMPSLGVMSEIEKANKIEIIAKYKKNKVEYLAQLHEKLGELKMTEQNQETLEAKGAKIIEEHHKAGKTKEDMIVALVNAGLKLGPASKLINRKLTDLGAIISRKERMEKGFEALSEMNFKPSNYEDVLAGVARVKDAVAQTDDGKAMSVIRKFAKENGIELPKKTKGAGNLRLKIFDYMIQNPASTKAEFTTFMENLNRGEKAINRAWETFEVAQKMANTLSGKKPDEEAA